MAMNSTDPNDETIWLTPRADAEVAGKPRRKGLLRTAGVLGVGAAAGGVLALGLNANASPSNTVQTAAGQYGAAESGQPGPADGRGPVDGHGPDSRLPLSGTVTAVGTSSVTIKTSSGTTEYAVDSKSEIRKDDQNALSALKVGDAVHFSTVTTNGKATIDELAAGDLRRGPGGNPLALSGTVTAVGTSSVTIKTSSGTTEYAVDSKSDIDKNGEAKLSDLKVGDTVRFGTVTTNGKVTIDKLHSGDEAKNRPQGRPPGDPNG
jgi:hypothetical protein